MKIGFLKTQEEDNENPSQESKFSKRNIFSTPHIHPYFCSKFIFREALLTETWPSTSLNVNSPRLGSWLTIKSYTIPRLVLWLTNKRKFPNTYNFQP